MVQRQIKTSELFVCASHVQELYVIACSSLCMQGTILFARKCVDMNIITLSMNIIICGHYEYSSGYIYV